MPRYRFQWTNVRPDLLQELASGLKLEGDAIESLKERYGSRPKKEFAKDAWPILLEKWLLRDPIAARQLAVKMKSRGLGDIETEDNITYLKSCRNASGLRDVVIDAFIELGEPDVNSTQENLEGIIAMQPERLIGTQLIAKAAELGNASKSELASEAGYLSLNEDGTERLDLTSFYEALLEAKGISLEEIEPEQINEDPLNNKEEKANAIIARLDVDTSKLGIERTVALQECIKLALAEYYCKGDEFWVAIEKVSALLAATRDKKESENELMDAVIRCLREQMVSSILLEKISENININSMARLNNRDRVQGALGILNPEDLEETVEILLNWDIFEASDPAELAEALAYYYSSLVETKDLDSWDLQFGFDDSDESLGSLEGWVELVRKKGVPECEIAKFLAEIKD
ncbi:MAG: hypothetical protein K9J75_04510 [Cyanobium usitatum Tobar12.5m-G36]|nr:hypothetical protein [Cyanobium usitatum Tobar12.5m-G36]